VGESVLLSAAGHGEMGSRPANVAACGLHTGRQRKPPALLRGRFLVYVTGLIALVIAASATTSVAHANFNDYASEHVELKPTSAKPETLKVGPIDSRNFNLLTPTSAESHHCKLGGETIYGSNSGWLRVESTVKGTISVGAEADKSEQTLYTVILSLFSGSEKLGCDWESLPGETIFTPVVGPVDISPGAPIDIQWLGATCLEPETPACPTPESAHVEGAGGPTSLFFTLTPQDTDKDGVPDTLDHCETVFGTEPNGCPPTPPPPPPPPVKIVVAAPPPKPPADTDHDGIPDSQDRCPSEFANASISEAGDGRAGCLEPLKHHLNVRFGKTRKGATLRVYSLVAPVGSQVTLRCRGRACPRSLPRLTTKTTTTSLVSLFRRGGLRRGKALWIPVGTTITVTVTPPNPPGGALGWRISFSPRRHGDPNEPETCVSLSGAPVKCPG
jgi:hypothetical protein